ncbi:MAG: hypothetical protein ACRD43_06355, partial [Pyrinomonadaceae bacterium]
MKTFMLAVSLVIFCATLAGQSDLQKLVDTENAFAASAAENGTKVAFLEYLSEDSIVFNPQRANGKEVWTARKASPSLLSWYPVYADVSENGLIGYTTGPWEYRPKGKDDIPAAFGHYMTIWQKQPDGKFRAVLDIGVSHEKPQNEERKFNVLVPKGKGPDVKSSVADEAARFFESVASNGAASAYKTYAAEDIRLMREGELPVVGKKAALKRIGSIKAALSISKRMAFFGSDDVAYTTSNYLLSDDGKKVETGNFVQVWKCLGGKWLIVMDVFVAD